MSEQAASETLERRARGGDPEAAETLGLDLLAGAEPGSERFERGLAWLEQAVAGGQGSALLSKGYVHLQHATLPGAPDIARACFEQAARAGDPLGVERLADLYLLGYGVARDETRAFSLYRRLAASAFPATLCQLAYLQGEGIGCEADEAAAATWVLRAAAQGHTLAFALAAERYATGAGVPRDPVLAAAWWELAAARGFPGAGDARERALHGLDGAPRQAPGALAERLKDNLRALGRAVAELPLPEEHPDYPARFNAAVEANFRRLGLPALDPDPDVRGADLRRRAPRSLRPEALAWRPRVFRIPDFASAEERAHLLDQAAPLLRSTAEVRDAGRAVEVDAFDGDCAVFPVYAATPVLRQLARRIALLTQVSECHLEPLSVLRYSAGQEYAPHVDYFDGGRMERHRQSGDFAGQRLATVLVHLLTPAGGGETCYPAAELSVAGAPGLAVVHYNTTPDCAGDPASLHHGRPIAAGEKWVARTAVRQASFRHRYEHSL